MEIFALRKLSRKQLIKRGVIAWFVLLFAVFSVDYLFSQLVWTRGESVKYVFFWKEKRSDVKMNDFVLVEGKKGSFSGGKKLTKKVMCMYPYRLKKEGLNFFCCDEKKCWYLHTAVKTNIRGVVLNVFDPCVEDKRNQYESSCVIEIPKDKYYLGTEVPDGYDSRYLGLFDRSEIISVLEPIF